MPLFFANRGGHTTRRSRKRSKRRLLFSLRDLINRIPLRDFTTGVTSGRVYQGNALGCMLVDHPLRRRFIHLVEMAWFDRSVLFLIILNSITMAMRDPLAESDPVWAVTFEWIFTVLFTIEAVCKVLALGLAFDTRTAYLHDGWNWLDLLTVVVSWLSLTMPDAGNLSAIRSVRTCRGRACCACACECLGPRVSADAHAPGCADRSARGC